VGTGEEKLEERVTMVTLDGDGRGNPEMDGESGNPGADGDGNRTNGGGNERGGSGGIMGGKNWLVSYFASTLG